MGTKQETLNGDDSIRIQLEASVARLTKELEALRAQNESLKQEVLDNGVPEHLAALVKEKVAAGLPHADAIDSARAQFEYDKQVAAELAAKESADKTKSDAAKKAAEGKR